MEEQKIDSSYCILEPCSSFFKCPSDAVKTCGPIKKISY